MGRPSQAQALDGPLVETHSLWLSKMPEQRASLCAMQRTAIHGPRRHSSFSRGREKQPPTSATAVAVTVCLTSGPAAQWMETGKMGATLLRNQ